MGFPLLDSLQSSVDVWFARRTSRLADDPLRPLPGGRSHALQRRIAALDVPAPLVAFVGQALGQAVAAWRSDPKSPNVLIVLSRPVEPMAPLIEAVLAGWDDPSTVCRSLLPCHRRPADPEAVPRMLTAALEGPLASTGGAGAVGEPVLLSLPNLDQCFLRCIDGWSGIEQLREVILERRDRFWLLGCNQWAWLFLDHVSQISSYFPSARALPALAGAQLREWLAPVAADPTAGGEPSADGGEDPAVDLWNQLAELACGSPRIAAGLWLAALRLDPEIDTDGGGMRQARPCLPDLPSLTDEDRYLLHSLLIHGTMRGEHLAFGLGLPSHRLQPRIHWLLGEGLIEAAAGELSVRPAHYPALVKALADNNFFTGEA